MMNRAPINDQLPALWMLGHYWASHSHGNVFFLTRPDLKTGLCGEHGAVPENIRFCMDAGLDYVSCSGYSVPIAQLAIAQINIEREQGGAEEESA